MRETCGHGGANVGRLSEPSVPRATADGSESRPTVFSPRGLSLIELSFVMLILAGSFVGIFCAMNFVASGMYSETVSADQYTRTTGTLYDVVSELREAASYSPHFYLEVNPTKAPSITFDKIDTVDANGNIVWGSMITYRLEHVATDASAQFESDHPGITQGRVVREEVASVNNQPQPAVLTVIEESVPYQITQNGASAWGFNITRDGCALTITLSRYGDTRLGTGAAANDTGMNPTSTTANSSNPLTHATLGTLDICTTKSVYFLKNPQVVIPAE